MALRAGLGEEEIAEISVIGRHLWRTAMQEDDLNAVQHGIPPLEACNFEALAASLKAISAVLLPGTDRQRELEKAIAWEKQRRAEAELRARLRAQEERRSFVAMIDRLVHKQAAKTVARQGIVIEETVEMVWRSLELGQLRFVSHNGSPHGIEPCATPAERHVAREANRRLMKFLRGAVAGRPCL
jgi:hypothetical protein